MFIPVGHSLVRTTWVRYSLPDLVLLVCEEEVGSRQSLNLLPTLNTFFFSALT